MNIVRRRLGGIAAILGVIGMLVHLVAEWLQIQLTVSGVPGRATVGTAGVTVTLYRSLLATLVSGQQWVDRRARSHRRRTAG